MRNVLLIYFKYKYYKSIWKVQNSFIENIKYYGPNLQSLDFFNIKLFIMLHVLCEGIYLYITCMLELAEIKNESNPWNCS